MTPFEQESEQTDQTDKDRGIATVMTLLSVTIVKSLVPNEFPLQNSCGVKRVIMYYDTQLKHFAKHPGCPRMSFPAEWCP